MPKKLISFANLLKVPRQVNQKIKQAAKELKVPFMLALKELKVPFILALAAALLLEIVKQLFI